MACEKLDINPIITKFVKDWPERLPDYTALATYVESECKTIARAHSIRCRFDARAKPDDTLEQSIYRRQSARQRKEEKRAGKVAAAKAIFKDEDEIFEAMHDLSGVRIRLYFPSDVDKMQMLIQAKFAPRNKTWDDSVNVFTGVGRKPSEEDYEQDEWPLAYKARHYRCRLWDQRLVKFQQPGGNSRMKSFEIQVASLIMYAWADIYHDVIYKPYYGKTTEDEEAFLDIVNGLAHTGELALKRLQTSLLAREATTNKAFSSAHALEDWLKQSLEYDVKEFVGINLLYDLLHVLQLNTPARLEPFIKDHRQGLIEYRNPGRVSHHDTLLPRTPIAANVLWLILRAKPEFEAPNSDIADFLGVMVIQAAVTLLSYPRFECYAHPAHVLENEVFHRFGNMISIDVECYVLLAFKLVSSGWIYWPQDVNVFGRSLQTGNVRTQKETDKNLNDIDRMEKGCTTLRVKLGLDPGWSWSDWARISSIVRKDSIWEAGLWGKFPVEGRLTNLPEEQLQKRMVERYHKRHAD